MATPAASVETSTAEAELLSIISGLLEEIGSSEAARKVELHSSLERDLGLGSLELVELLVRVERQFGRRLPDETAQHAETPTDWLKALHGAGSSQGAASRYSIRQPAEAAPAPPASATSFMDVLRGQADSVPDRVHVHLIEEDSGQDISYSRLLENSAEVAAGLAAAGLRPNDTVAIMLPTCEDFFYAFLGVMLAGGIAVPIYPPAQAHKIGEYVRRQALILKNADVRFLISFDQVRTVSKVMGLSLPGRVEVTTVESLRQRGRGGRAPQVDAADTFFIQYTSGSTGNPKGAVLSHANVLANIRAIGGAIGARPDDVVVSWLPLYHDMGLIGSWLFSVYHGFPITILSPPAFLSRPERWLWALHDSRGTLSPAPNFSYELCARKIQDKQIKGVDLSAWRVAINGGEPVLPDTLTRFAERFAQYGFRPESYVPCYGLAESSVALTFPPLNRAPKIDVIERKRFEAEGRAVPASSDAAAPLRFVANGKALPGHQVRIAGEDGQEVTERMQGRVLFRGPSKTAGYFQNPEATAAAVDEDGWMDTGDLGYFADGEIYLTGRKKDCIIKAGHNIIPQEVEMAAADVPGVRPGCVAAFGSIDVESGTEKLVVVAEIRWTSPSEHSRIKADIVGLVDERVGLPPDHVELVPPQTVPKTSSGKIRRAETRSLYESGRLVTKRIAPWMQIVRLWMENSGRWIDAGIEGTALWAEDLGGTIVRANVAVAGALLARLSPSRRAAAGIVVTTARVLCRLNGDRCQASAEAGRPALFVANRSGPLDALYLVSTLPRPTLLTEEQPLRSLTWPLAFLLEPLMLTQEASASDNGTLQERVEQALEGGYSVLMLSDSPKDGGPGRSRFRLEPMLAAEAAGSPVVPVYIGTGNAKPAGNGGARGKAGAVVRIGRPARPANNGKGITKLRDEIRRRIVEMAAKRSDNGEC